MWYSAKPHALAYSFVGIQTLYLATNYPTIYWNCACLIVNAGGADLLDVDEVIEEEDTDTKKNKSVNYGKISAAIGESRKKGILVLPPDINKSDLIFKPDLEKNAIIYGMKGITRIGTQLVVDIFLNRPYTSITDFMTKVKVNKTQMISLIKAGVFDNLYNGDRLNIMKEYIDLIADKKKRITLQNMQMLIAKQLLPEELDMQRRVFNFNKYLKKSKEKDNYILDNIALNFFNQYYDNNLLTDVQLIGENSQAKINILTWDKIYQKEMDVVRNWMKDNQQEILDKLNDTLYQETWDKYAKGTLSSWEMESLGFYYHEHELANLRNDIYEIDDFFNLPLQPEVERTFMSSDSTEIKMFKISRIAGTVIDKDKNKSSVMLLTPTGVVTVKVWKNQFAAWDKQISERGADGVKHIVEKSWFQKGTKLIITGIRREDNFIPKKYKSTTHPLFEKIIDIDDNGWIVNSTTERTEVKE